MKKRNTVLLCAASALGLIASSIIYLLDDDDTLILEPDLSLHAPLTESCITGYKRLQALLQNEINYATPSPPCCNEKDDGAWNDGYRNFLITQADSIISDYKQVTPLLPDLYEIADSECIVFPVTNYEDPFVKFRPIRSLSKTILQNWELSCIQGGSESKIEEVLALYKVGKKLTKDARIIVDFMIGVVITRNCMTSIERGLPNMSHQQLIEVEQTLERPIMAQQRLSRTLVSEYCMAANELETIINEQYKTLLGLTVKRNATLNTYASHLMKQIELAKEKDWEAFRISADKLEAELNSLHIKNRVGWQFLAMAIPGALHLNQEAAKLDEAQIILLEKVFSKLNVVSKS